MPFSFLTLSSSRHRKSATQTSSTQAQSTPCRDIWQECLDQGPLVVSLYNEFRTFMSRTSNRRRFLCVNMLFEIWIHSLWFCIDALVTKQLFWNCIVLWHNICSSCNQYTGSSIYNPLTQREVWQCFEFCHPETVEGAIHQWNVGFQPVIQMLTQGQSKHDSKFVLPSC